jgi:F420-dependent oxidoreductase-like protein
MTLTLGLNTMSPAVNFGPWGSGPAPNLKMVKHAEALGFDTVWTSEASGTDAVSPIAYIAGQTSTIKVGTNIMQMAGRSPATTAMTAVTLDSLSGGRFVLGLGVSGPAVVEGWHSMRYGKPISRSREYITIVREIVARKKPLEFHGEYFDIPYQGEGATGLARPIKLMVRPRRPRIPLFLAAIGPNNVRLALEMCDGILPPVYSPYKEHLFFAGQADRATIDAQRQDLGLGPVQLAPFVPVIVGDDVDKCIDKMRPTIAFWLGAMGPKTMNFYNRMACRFGYEKEATEIQELYWEGKRSEAAARVPVELADEISLCGPRERIRDRLDAWRESSVTQLIVTASDEQALTTLAELIL